MEGRMRWTLVAIRLLREMQMSPVHLREIVAESDVPGRRASVQAPRPRY